MATSNIAALDIPEVRIRDWDSLYQSGANPALDQVLRNFLASRRWYRSKTRTMTDSQIEDVISIPGTGASLVLLEVEYAEGDRDIYALTLAVALLDSGEAVPAEHRIARITTEDGYRGTLYDGLWNPRFDSELLKAMAGDLNLDGRRGQLRARHTRAFEALGATSPARLEPRVSKAEQSNSSIFYGDRFILKMFRKLEEGVNPELEVGRFLTEHGFRHTPAVAGYIEHDGLGAAMQVGVLQQFVPNRGDAWEYSLQAAKGFFERAARYGPPPELISEHPLVLAAVEIPALARELMGDYLDAAKLLGERTAEMHTVLADPEGGPDFAPEPFSGDCRDELQKRLEAQTDTAIDLVKKKLPMLHGPAAADARKLLEIEPQIREEFRAICENPIQALRIRHHGDFHLGQTLYTGQDFFIIDFEGEPARSLAERRKKGAAMRDVAGLLRSFQYAAYSVLMRNNREPSPAAEGWAAFWASCAGAAYLEAYFRQVNGNEFSPSDPVTRKLLLDVFLLEKALYEVAYELNNRPDWVRIPLRGIVGMMV